MKLVNKPGAVFRSYSLWGMLAGLFMMAQEIVPFWEGVVDDHTFTVMGSIALTLGVVGRFIDQGISKEQEKKP